MMQLLCNILLNNNNVQSASITKLAVISAWAQISPTSLAYMGGKVQSNVHLDSEA